MLAWILLAFSLLTTPAAAQAPPAVPALPDTQRLTSYAIKSSELQNDYFEGWQGLAKHFRKPSS